MAKQNKVIDMKKKIIEIEAEGDRYGLRMTKEKDMVVMETVDKNGKRDAMIALYPDEVRTVAEALLEMIE